MATNLGNRVTYRSPDALQNLRLKVTLTRISGPRMDRAREMDARFGSGPTPQAQIQAAQQQAQQQAQQAASLAAPAPLAREPPPPSTPPPAPPVAPTQSQSFGGDALAGEGDDATTYRGPTAAPASSSRRNRSMTQQAQAALPGQGIPAASGQAAPGQAPFDPYGGNNAGPGGPVTESYSPPVAESSHSPVSSSASPPGLRRVEAWTDDDDVSPSPDTRKARPGPVVEGAGGADSLRDEHAGGSFQARRVDTGEVQTFTREIAWQEKIFSFGDVDRLARREPETELERKYAGMIRERGGPTSAGEIIYTYVSADAFADERDAERTVTTSEGERWNGLFRAVFGTPSQRVLAKNASGRDATRLRTELAHGRRRRAGTEPSTFAICADCGPLSLPPGHPVFKNSPHGANAEREQVLMTIEAYPDGSIALTPDFSQSEDDTRRIERRDGSVWEYSVVNASERRETPLERRTKDIAPAAALRRLQLTRKAVGAFAAPPGEKPGSVRFLALAEIVAGRGFDRDFLYCEWVLDYDKDVWRVEGESGGQTSGVTQISKCVKYPATGDGEGDAWSSGDRAVAHWSLPVELSCVADSVPPPAKHPVIYFQVSSYDEWDRYRCEGYGRLNLGALPVGSRTEVIKTWKAGGTVADRVASQFVGGSPEIGDVSYAGVPADAKDKPVHSRLGFVADSSGEIKVRVNIVTQTKADASAAAKKGLGLLKGLLGKGAGGKGGEKDGAISARERFEKKEAVEDVVSRARARLAEARAQNRQNSAAAPRAMLLSRREAEARPAPAHPAPYAYAGTGTSGAAPPGGAGDKATVPGVADALARARARVSGGSGAPGSAPESAPVPAPAIPAPAVPAVPAVPVPETPAPNMASPPVPPPAPAVESIDDDGTVSSLGVPPGAGLMSAFEHVAAASRENVAPGGTTVVGGTESKGPVAADVVGAASAP